LQLFVTASIAKWAPISVKITGIAAGNIGAERVGRVPGPSAGRREMREASATQSAWPSATIASA
jgi:hypothetical protein